MGAVNYKTSDYITIGYNCNTEYAQDDFWKDEEEQRAFEISFLHDELTALLEKYDFQFYHVTICPGYYEGFTIDIENNFPFALDSWTDRREMNKEVTQIKRFLLECITEWGLVECSPGWCTGYSTEAESVQAVKAAIKVMRAEIADTLTLTQYEKGA